MHLRAPTKEAPVQKTNRATTEANGRIERAPNVIDEKQDRATKVTNVIKVTGNPILQIDATGDSRQKQGRRQTRQSESPIPVRRTA